MVRIRFVEFLVFDGKNKEVIMTQELNRFLSMWKRSIYRFDKVLNGLTDEALRSIPIPSDSNFLGNRVGEIMIDTLIRHLVIAESHWFKTLASVNDGDIIPKPESIVANAELNKDNAAEFYVNEITKSLPYIENLTDEQLIKKVKWDNNTFTVMGFLWAISNHHTYHLGQIDLLLRQNNITPLDIFDPKSLGEGGVIG